MLSLISENSSIISAVVKRVKCTELEYQQENYN